MATRPSFALFGIDGLYLSGRTLVAVQNGTVPERVLVMRLDPGCSRVLDWHVAIARAPGLGDPMRMDFNATSNGNDRIFVRGNLMDDSISYAPQFPGEPPGKTGYDNSKGIFVGYTAIVSSHVVNNFRYGFVRQGVGTSGQNPYSYASMWNLADQVSFARTTKVNVPVQQFVDDVTWSRGKHTIQFGGNWRLIHNNRSSDAQNYFSASPHPTFFAPNGTIANSGQDLDPALLADQVNQYPLVSGAFGGSYDAAASEGSPAYLAGSALPTCKINQVLSQRVL